MNAKEKITKGSGKKATKAKAKGHQVSKQIGYLGSNTNGTEWYCDQIPKILANAAANWQHCSMEKL